MKSQYALNGKNVFFKLDYPTSYKGVVSGISQEKDPKTGEYVLLSSHKEHTGYCGSAGVYGELCRKATPFKVEITRHGSPSALALGSWE